MRILTKNNKKGMIFNIMIVVLTTVVLTSAFTRLSVKTTVEEEIGERPLKLIGTVQEGEKALIFLDFAAKMAIYQAVFDMQAAGGITDTAACGTYYGFNMWNGPSGESCFVDASVAQDSLRDFFVSNLVARVAAYPTADFIGNIPEVAAAARGAAIAAQDRMGVAVGPGAAQACVGGREYMQDFDFAPESGYFPQRGGRVWVPAQANCKGSYPLIVFLHGCMVQNGNIHEHFGNGKSNDLIPWTKSLLQSGKYQPVILAAPSQTLGGGSHKTYGPNAPCGGQLWSKEFSPSKFLDLVRANLPAGVTISSISFVGHSGAGCLRSGGLYKALDEVPNMFAIGHFDSCTAQKYAQAYNSKIGSKDTRFLAVYASMGEGRVGFNQELGITESMTCPVNSVPAGDLKGCFSDASKKYFGFGTAAKHHPAVLVGMEQFLKHFFSAEGSPPAQADTPAQTTTSTPPSTQTTTPSPTNTNP
jgi:hypothetical protein